MKYRLRLDRSPHETIPRILSAQAARAADVLKREPGAPSAIHAARKHFKRIDALLLLSEPLAAAPREIATVRKRLKRLARKLSARRDADVIAGVMAELHAEYGKPSNRKAFLRLEARLEDLRGHLNETVAGDECLNVAKRLDKLEPRLLALEFQNKGLDVLAASAADTYAQGRRAMKLAFETDDEEVWHDWRRYVQRHARHMALLKEVWPDEIAARLALARQIAAGLGAHHDLAVLRETLKQDSSGAADDGSHRWFFDLVRKKQNKLEKQVIPQGKLLFAEKAKDFHKRIRLYSNLKRDPIK